MADSPNPEKPKKDLSMEQRLLLAFLLMGVVLLVSQYLLPKPVPPKPDEQKKAEQKPPEKQPAEQKPVVAKSATPAAATAKVPGAKKEADAAPEKIAATTAQEYTVETDVSIVRFSNRGATVKSWVLKKYKDSTGKQLDLVNPVALAKGIDLPFSYFFKDQKPSVDLNKELFAAKVGDNGLRIDFEFSDGKVVAKKSFVFEKKRYLSTIASEVTQSGVPLPHLFVWRGGFGDSTVAKAYAAQHSTYYDATAGKLIVGDSKEGKDAPVVASGQFTFAGLEDAYFAAVILPPAMGTVEIQTTSNNLPVTMDSTDNELHVGAMFGGAGKQTYELYVGPKDVDILRGVNPKLEVMVDWGRWFGFLAKPLFQALNWMNDHYVHNFGWTIILVTVIINFMLLPLKFTSMKSMQKMQALQPQIAAINDRYKNVGLKDPRKAEQNQEVMALYKKHGANPMGGCMPMVLQIPFFAAFYTVLSVAIELRGANWLWVSDLSQPETLAIRVLPVTMVATQFIMQKMTPSASVDPSQQRMMMLMPLVFGFMFYYSSSGLVLYWLTGNVVGIVQQWFFNRFMPVKVSNTTIVVKNKNSRK
jgi:YidC/Oxa1 family membrane protein insertase